jgi:menaquinone-dependent protoporphyrinogen oxidase
MKVLVAYSSRHGATKGIAERIASTLANERLDVTFRPIAEVEDVAGFDAFVIGSSVYMFHWEKEAAEFVRKHPGVLGSHPVWLFCSGPVGTEMIDKQGKNVVESARPKEFEEFAEVIHPRGEQVFFGVYDPMRENATIAERLVTRIPAIRDALPAGDFRDWPLIEAWAQKIARELNREPVAV